MLAGLARARASFLQCASWKLILTTQLQILLASLNSDIFIFIYLGGMNSKFVEFATSKYLWRIV